MSEIILMRGLPGSGKSTAAKNIIRLDSRYKRVNRDDLRVMVDNGTWSRAREDHIIHVETMLADYYLAQGFNVIIDDTNLATSVVERWRAFAREHSASFEIIDYTGVTLKECIERDNKRANGVGERVIKRMWRQYLMPQSPKPEHNPNLPDAIICDLDGTIALLNGRSPYDASTCEKDLPNEPIISIIEAYKSKHPDCRLIFTSGRSAEHRDQTERWLTDQGMFQYPYFMLFMRPEKDSRPDNEIKREIYEREILGKYNVQFVLDDRDQVVELWRSLGLTCLQVADGDF